MKLIKKVSIAVVTLSALVWFCSRPAKAQFGDTFHIYRVDNPGYMDSTVRNVKGDTVVGFSCSPNPQSGGEMQCFILTK